MRTFGLVACSATKRDGEEWAAQDLYVSPLFRAARRHCERNHDGWGILSAKYGLLLPTDVVAPYNLTLNTMSPTERRVWSDHVLAQVAARCAANATFYLYAGVKYREFLVPRLGHVVVPLAGLGIGQQLAWFNREWVNRDG